MILHSYTIYDSKSGVYSKPFLVTNLDNKHALAVRLSTDIRNDKSTDPGRHPEDFCLFCIGTFDDSTAKFSPYASCEHVVNFHELPQSV